MKTKDELINLILHCFDMHDYPELEALPYIAELGQMMGYNFEHHMAKEEMSGQSEDPDRDDPDEDLYNNGSAEDWR